MIEEIRMIEDVRTFFNQLSAESLNFHPDTPFEDYIDTCTELATYTKEAAEIRNHLLGRCFEICDREDVDIYELCLEIFQPQDSATFIASCF